MDSGLLLTASLAVVLFCLAGEVRHWWRPLPPAGALERRLKPGAPETPPRARQQSRRSWVLGLVAGLAAAVLGVSLSRNLWLGLLPGVAAGLVGAWLLPRWQRQRRREQAQAELRLALEQLAVSLRAGRSLPTALRSWPDEITRVLGPGQHPLLAGAHQVRLGLDRGATPEEALAALARRLELEEAHLLARVASLCRRRGGDLGEAVAGAAGALAGKLEVLAQIRTLTAGKRAEAWVISLMGPAVLIAVALESPDYLMPLLTSTTGRALLVAAVTMQVLAFLLGRWLLQMDL